MTSLLRISLYGLLSLGAAGSSFFAIKPAFLEETPVPPASVIDEREEAPVGIVFEEDDSALEQLDKEASKCDATPPVKVAPKPAPKPKATVKPSPKPTPKPKAAPKPTPKPKTTTKKKTTKKSTKQSTKKATPTPAPAVRVIYPVAPYGVPVVPVQRVVYPAPVVPVQRVVYPAQVPVRRVVYPAPVPVRVVQPHGYYR